MSEKPNVPKKPAPRSGQAADRDDLAEKSLQRERAAKWLGEKWKNHNCIACGSNSWTLGVVFELRAFHDGNLVLGPGPILPVFPVTCGVCGNTMFVNALMAGVVIQSPTGPPADETDEAK